MTLKPDEIKRRISAARILRGMEQPDLDRLGAAEGYGKLELGRVERGEIPYRPGKHLDVLCRILNVPRWWFTAETLDFGGVDAPATPDEVASLLAQQNDLLARQSDVLQSIEARLREQQTVRDEVADLIEARGREIVQGRPAAEPDPQPVPRQTSAAGTKRAAKPRSL